MPLLATSLELKQIYCRWTSDYPNIWRYKFRSFEIRVFFSILFHFRIFPWMLTIFLACASTWNRLYKCQMLWFLDWGNIRKGYMIYSKIYDLKQTWTPSLSFLRNSILDILSSSRSILFKAICDLFASIMNWPSVGVYPGSITERYRMIRLHNSKMERRKYLPRIFEGC